MSSASITLSSEDVVTERPPRIGIEGDLLEDVIFKLRVEEIIVGATERENSAETKTSLFERICILGAAGVIGCNLNGGVLMMLRCMFPELIRRRNNLLRRNAG